MPHHTAARHACAHVTKVAAMHLRNYNYARASRAFQRVKVRIGENVAATGAAAPAQTGERLLLVVDAHQHANEFAGNLAMMIVQALQIGNEFDVGRFKP